MNVENIKRVRDHIASLPPERLDMRFYYSDDAASDETTAAEIVHDCGTAACICGWAFSVLSPQTSVRDVDLSTGAELLGLDGNDAGDLFLPDGLVDGVRYTQADAVRVLDHLMATGRVDWSVIDREPA